MRVLGLDVGDRRIGVAMSDELGITAQGLTQIERRHQRADLAALLDIITAHEVSQVVVGMPRNMNGTYGPQAEKTERFIHALEPGCPVPCIRWDERLTTLQAERLLIAANQRRTRRKAVRDKLAAQLMLQSYLDYQRACASRRA